MSIRRTDGGNRWLSPRPGRKPGVRHFLPKIGEHADEVLRELIRR
jgi:hypothetical protein